MVFIKQKQKTTNISEYLKLDLKSEDTYNLLFYRLNKKFCVEIQIVKEPRIDSFRLSFVRIIIR